MSQVGLVINKNIAQHFSYHFIFKIHLENE